MSIRARIGFRAPVAIMDMALAVLIPETLNAHGRDKIAPRIVDGAFEASLLAFRTLHCCSIPKSGAIWGGNRQTAPIGAAAGVRTAPKALADWLSVFQAD